MKLKKDEIIFLSTSESAVHRVYNGIIERRCNL